MAENISVNGVTYNGVDSVEFETPEGKSVGFYPDAVRYTEQTLTDEQRAQAKKNIGVLDIPTSTEQRNYIEWDGVTTDGEQYDQAYRVSTYAPNLREANEDEISGILVLKSLDGEHTKIVNFPTDEMEVSLYTTQLSVHPRTSGLLPLYIFKLGYGTERDPMDGIYLGKGYVSFDVTENGNTWQEMLEGYVASVIINGLNISENEVISPAVLPGDIVRAKRTSTPDLILASDGAGGTKWVEMEQQTPVEPEHLTIEVLTEDPAESELYEGRIWILKTKLLNITSPVIELVSTDENSITLQLSNASFDENGDVVTFYNIYLNNAVWRYSVEIAAGDTFTVTGLSPSTEYQISVSGVKDNSISEQSNKIIVTTSLSSTNAIYIMGENNCVGVLGAQGSVANGVHYLIWNGVTRGVMVSTVGDDAFTNNSDKITDTYYPLRVPPLATSVTLVSTAGLMFSYNGYTVTNGSYARTVDSGWKNSGTTITLTPGQCQYCYFFFKRSDGADISADFAGITATFA